MRTFFALVLVSYLTVFTAPFVVLAEDGDSQQGDTGDQIIEEDSSTTDGDSQQGDTGDQIIEEDSSTTNSADEKKSGTSGVSAICPFGEIFVYSPDDDRKAKEDEYAVVSAAQSAAMANSYSLSTCGEPNYYTGLYEKGDCSADGLVVTEITETIAPDTELDANNKIITLYSGLCCAAYTEGSDSKFKSCDDTRTIYTATYAECTGFAANCEKRQWIIGDSGIGIIKLMVKQIYVFGAFAVGTIAVSTMIFQGIKISVSGVSGDISDAKNKILQALSGIVLLFLSGLILYSINPNFFG